MAIIFKAFSNQLEVDTMCFHLPFVNAEAYLQYMNAQTREYKRNELGFVPLIRRSASFRALSREAQGPRLAARERGETR